MFTNCDVILTSSESMADSATSREDQAVLCNDRTSRSLQ